MPATGGLRIDVLPHAPACAHGLRERVACLMSIPLFERLAPSTLEVVAARLRAREIKRGGIVFLEGQPARALNLLAAGRVKVVRETEAGREVIVRLIGPGDIFGAAGGWGEEVYPATAIAQEDAVVLRLEAATFADLLQSEPDFALAVIRELGRRLREAEARIRDLQSEAVESRIARALLRMAARSGPPAELPLSRQDLAELAGTTLSTASRTLSAWDQRGIVAARRERVALLDRAALASIARGEAARATT